LFIRYAEVALFIAAAGVFGHVKFATGYLVERDVLGMAFEDAGGGWWTCSIPHFNP
jgi:hypothetical protein